MTDRQGPRPVADGWLTQLVQGFGYNFEALSFLRKHKLWGLTTIAIGVNVVLLGILVTISMMYLVPALQGLNEWFTSMVDWAWLQAVLAVISWVVSAAAIILAVAINAFLLVLVGQAVASPFLDMLSEKVESIVLGTESQPFSVPLALRSLMVGVADIVWSLSFWLAVQIPLLVIGFIPVVGTAASSVIGFCFTALILSHEFVGMPLTRKHVPYRNRWRLVWSNRMLSVGFGSSTMALLVVPGLNLLLLPLAAVGGTLMYCDLKGAGLVDGNDISPPELEQSAA